MTVIGTTEVEVRAKTDQLPKDIQAGAEEGSEKAKSSILGNMAGAAAAIGGLFVADKVVDFFKEGIQSAAEYGKTLDQTSAVIKSTGGAANVTKKNIDDYSQSMEDKTGIDKNSIASGENMLLTFTNVRNEVGKGKDIFNQASNTLLDLSTAMGTDSKGAAIQLGKALNDPEKGITALTRVGVTFTDQQKDQIKAMQDAGNMAGAQSIILGELQREFGGSAEAAGKSAAGQFAILQNRFHDIAEEVGGALLPILVKVATYLEQAVAAAFAGVGTIIAKVKQEFIEHRDAVNQVEAAFRSVETAISPVFNAIASFVAGNHATVLTAGLSALGVVIMALLIPAIGSLVGLLGALFSPIVLVTLAIAGIAAGLEYAWTHFQTFRTVVETVVTDVQIAFDVVSKYVLAAISAIVGFVESEWPKISEIFNDVFTIIKTLVEVDMAIIWGTIQTVLTVIETIWHIWGDNILSYLSIAWQTIQDVVRTAINVVLDVIQLVLDIVTGKWGKVWGDIKQLFSDVWNGIISIGRDLVNQLLNMLDAAWNGIKAAASAAWGALKSIVSGAFDGVKGAVESGISGAVSLVTGLPGKITGALGDVGHMLYDAGAKIIQGLIDGITSKVSAVTSKISDVAGTIKSHLPFSPAKRGPLSGQGNPFFSGQSIVNLLAQGMESQQGALANSMANVMGNIGGALGGGSQVLSLAGAGAVSNTTNNIYANSSQGEYGWTSALQRQELLRARRR